MEESSQLNSVTPSILDISKVGDLGESLRLSGVKAMFLGDGNHNSDSADLQMAAAVAGFKPDITFVEAGTEVGNPRGGVFMKNAADAAGSKIIGVDPWPEEKKNLYYEHRNAAGQAIEKNRELAKQREEIAKTGDAKQLQKIDEQLLETASLFRSHQAISSKMLSERQGDDVNDGIAENMANEIEKFYKQNGRMPTFAVKLGKSHIEDGNDVDEMLMKKLRDKGLPTEQYKNHKDISFDEKAEPGQGALIEKRRWYSSSEFEYKVHAEKEVMSPKNIPDARSNEGTQQSASAGR